MKYVRNGWIAVIALGRGYPHCVQMDRATITLAVSVLLVLIGCDRPQALQVRLVNLERAPSGCHLTLNGVRIPDDVLVEKGRKQRGKQAVASRGEDAHDRCVGAAIMLRQTGVNIHELPSIDLRS